MMDYVPGNTPGVVRSTYGSQGKIPVTHTIQHPKPLGPEYSPWFWHPYNVAVRFAPEEFRKRLHAIDTSLEVTWDPMKERWLVWALAPKVRHGWRLLFIHWDSQHNYLPLDERVFARIFQVDSAKNGGKRYFDRIVEEFERDQRKRRAEMRQDAIDRAMPYWEHSQIKNIGKGNKFSTYFA
jgi:hypothetical protein